MILGVLTCAKKKLPVPAPAWLLYAASPRFSQQYQALVKVCDAVLILSAKHGPVTPNTILVPYNQLLIRPTSEWVNASRNAILAYQPNEIVSYLSVPYTEALPSNIPTTQIAGGIYERAQSIGVQGKLKRSERSVCFPMMWVLEFVATAPRSFDEVSEEVRRRGYTEATVGAQLQRTKICPLHQLVNGKVENKYVKDLHGE